MNELEEIRREAYDDTPLRKERVKIIHDKQINRKMFSPGQKVLLYNSRLHPFPRKFRFRWTTLILWLKCSLTQQSKSRTPQQTMFLKSMGIDRRIFLTCNVRGI